MLKLLAPSLSLAAHALQVIPKVLMLAQSTTKKPNIQLQLFGTEIICAGQNSGAY